MTLSLWIYALLFTSLTEAHGLSYFPENFVVAKGSDANPVTLTCGTKTNGTVTWKFDGELMEAVDFEDKVQQNGQNLTVSEVETPMLGEYSCWRGEEMLSSTYLLLEAEEEEELDWPFSCRAKSYDCNFTCDWTLGRYTAVHLGLGHECREGGKLCHWVNSSTRLLDGGFQFELSHSLSPYAEETTMLEVTAEAIINLSILRRTKRFYLRDIVQPDSPQIVKCQEVEQDLNVTIDPPTSWSTPHSFFSLEHEIEYVFKDDGTTGRSSSARIPKRISKLRVRSRDSLVFSAWSQWTPWKNVRIGKKNPCKCKKTAKSCRPELPSGSLDHCKKKGKKKRNKDPNRSQTS
ncbi:interleukin-12 subunit beta isoform X2 [Siniperca chuatsi]|uniref:interleukin-12 subunit beta isoform X2 n=1 Tax=Siniperca chuatsi TaxID=119488 RepID=UPI001CE1F608|nr:interleukin-12 subunit beta isoform X2 [Siniperca chuatsi]